MLLILHINTAFWLISLLFPCSSGYELLDTIHALKEENIHLQHRLDDINQALRDLKQLLIEHSKVSGWERDTEYLHAWKEWSRHGISADSHRMLQQTLCLSELRDDAHHVFIAPRFILISPLISLTVFSCLSS